MGKKRVYQFRADLKGIKPAMWRRFQVSEKETMQELAERVMWIFDFLEDNWYSLTELSGDQFKREYKKKRKELQATGQDDDPKITPLDPRMKNISYVMEKQRAADLKDWTPNIVQPGQTRLKESQAQAGSTFLFEYDLRAEWEVKLKLEKIVEEDITSEKLPRVLKGKGPGVMGAIDIEDLKQMVADDLVDMDDFDLEDLNYAIKGIE